MERENGWSMGMVKRQVALRHSVAPKVASGSRGVADVTLAHTDLRCRTRMRP